MKVILLIYVDSYFFVSSTSILQVGVGLTSNRATCEYPPRPRSMINIVRAAIFMCIFFYFTTKVCFRLPVLISKVIIYLFLIERVHIVRGGKRASRFKNKVYLINVAGLLPYGVIAVLAIVFRVNDLDDSGRCLIGVERRTSILVLVYDLFINVFQRWHR